MASGADLCAWYEAHKGIPYSTAAWMATRDGADEIRSDCSGTQSADYRNVVGVSCPNLSWTQAKWCYDNGGRISVDEARNRPPGTCWLFMGPNAGLEGWGPSGHVALVRDHDTTLETPAWGSWGHASGIGRISGRNWSGAGVIPGLGAGPAPAPKRLYYSTTGAQGMLVKLAGYDDIIHLGPAYARHVSGPDAARLLFIGINRAPDGSQSIPVMSGEEIRGWARTWGVPEGTWPL
jgi:hypothetical protein